MKYFLTGITGFIGSNLARHLLANGNTVHALARSTVSPDLKDQPGLRIFKGDLDDRNAIRDAMKGCDFAFHMAAFAKPWSKNPGDYKRINVDGTINVFDAALNSGVEKVVFTSSAATMEPTEDGKSVSESTPRTVSYFNLYESTKAEAETRAMEYCDRGLPVVIVNPSRVYGPGPLNPSNSVTKMIISFAKGRWHIIPGQGQKIGNYVFIDDVVRGHILAVGSGRAGERYILGGENMTFDEFFRNLEKVSGRHNLMVHLPLGVMSVAAGLMQWQASITGIPPLITTDFVRKYLNHWSLSSEKAVEELGYRITPFEKGVKETLEWFGI